MLDCAPDQVADPLGYVLSLADAGLAEMHAPIFELRPESLETEGLIAALEKQASALRARHDVGVEAVLCDEPNVLLEKKESLYRIAQEALHNTVKHARATAVDLMMECDPGRITLTVSGEGAGFDPGGFSGTPGPAFHARARHAPGRDAEDRVRRRREHASAPAYRSGTRPLLTPQANGGRRSFPRHVVRVRA